MTDSKLITLLKLLDAHEFKELEKFAASPFHARGRDLNSFYKILKPFYPEFDEKKLTREYLFKKLYPDEKYSAKVSDHKLRMLFSAMYKLCMDFLIQVELQNDVAKKNHYLLTQLRKKKLNKEFEKAFEESMIDSELLKGSATDFLNKYFLHSEQKNYMLTTDNYNELFEASYLMREYSVLSALVNSLKHESERIVAASYNAKSRPTLMHSLIETIDMEKLLDILEKNNDRFYPYVLIYYTAYKMETVKDGEVHFRDLKRLLKEYESIFGSMEKFALWVMLETYCFSRSSGKDYQNLRSEAFEIHKEMLAYGIYKAAPGEDFNIQRFRNIISNAAQINEFDWLEGFIEKYSDELHPRHKEDMENYSRALLNLGRKNYEKSLEHITKIRYEFFLYKIDVKVMQMKVYYELKYFEQIYSLADTTLHYLKNTNVINRGHSDSVKYLIKYLKLILKYSENGGSKNDLMYIKDQIQNEEYMNHRKWLLEKVEELV